MQFSLGRMLQLVFVVAVISALFGHLAWPLALLALSGLNGIASVWFWLTKRSRLGKMAALTAILILATLFFTDWGFSSPHPVVRVAWPLLVAACIAELVTIVMWLVSVPPTVRLRRIALRATARRFVGNHRNMLIHFEFVDGPMKGTEFSGEAEGDNEASGLYSMTRNGAVGAEFNTISVHGRRAIEEWVKSSGSTEVGGPYEHYVYRVVDRIENESAISVRATFVDRVPFPR